MNRPRKRPIIGPAPIDKVWLAKEFEQLHREHNLILLRINDQPVTAELEAAVNRVSVLAKKIDLKVPDKNVPPGSTTPTRKGKR